MEKKATRDAYGDALLELGAEYPEIVVLDADLCTSTRVDAFAERYPERFFQLGVAEQNMVGVAAGMATTGKVPFVSTFAVFGSARVCDQVRNSVAYPELRVRLGVTHAGITVGADGASHQSVEDLGIMRSIPGMKVIAPSDYWEARAAVRASMDYDGPVYLRFSRGKLPLVFNSDYSFNGGQVKVLKEGEDVTIFAMGVMLERALKAASLLDRDGIRARVVNVALLKPIDREGIIASVKKTGCAVTAEEHNIFGGLGSAVAEVTAEEYPVPIKRIGLNDTFGKSGSPDELLEDFGLTTEALYRAARDLYQDKV